MKRRATILVIDDEPSICWALKKMGQSTGLAVETASSAEQGLQRVASLRPDVVLLDVRLPGMDGLSAVARFRQRLPGVPIVIMTAYGDLDTAVRAVGTNVFEYIVKPFDLEQIRQVIEQALLVRGTRERPVEVPVSISGFVGETAVMQEVYKAIALAAASDASVLVTGESGTGKELAARAIHQHSQRCNGPFVPVNLASLPSTLIESELFGHVRGAFTGADRDREGLLVQASGGTLFLDEIADIPPAVQVKLLRVLEENRVTPVGGRTSQATDFRVVAATHQNLWSAVERGDFRHDLYFRLAAFSIELPPLRQRLDDVPRLAEHFLAQFGHPTDQLVPETIEELMARPWYGNVRELRNAIEHATIVARHGTILPSHLPPAVPRPLTGERNDPHDLETRLQTMIGEWARLRAARPEAAGTLHERLLELVERPLFTAVLEQVQGNYRAAAERLGIHRTTLRRKIPPT